MALTVLSCSGGSYSPTDPGNGTSETFDLRVGQPVAVNAVLHIRLLSVDNDSRCPVDVTCVSAGNADVVISASLGTGPDQPLTLSVNPPTPVLFGGYTIAVVRLAPDRHVNVQINQADYVATVKVTH